MEDLMLAAVMLLLLVGASAGAGDDDRAYRAAAYPVTWTGGRTSDWPAPPAPPPAGDGGDKSFAVNPNPVKWKGALDVAPSPAAPPLPHMSIMSISVERGVLFLRKDLHVGAVLPRGMKLAQEPVPVGSAEEDLPKPQDIGSVLSKFGIAQGSKKAAQVADTINLCADVLQAATTDEPQTCASSRRAATEFAAAALGTRGEPRMVVTAIHGRVEPEVYKVAGITPLGTDAAVVACHPLPYPYEVFFCHKPSKVQALRVELVGGLGTTAIAVCHLDTSMWASGYFDLLGGVRGEGVCHYMPEHYLLFMAAA